jgi:glutamate N-acetyltransferase/amino-acid N-acetyltransferase
MQTGAEFYAQCKPHSSLSSTNKIANNRSGYTALPPSTISPTSVSVSFIPPPTSTNTTPLKLLTNGEPEPSIDEDRAAEILKEEDLEVEIDLGNGAEKAEVWTCDFSHVSHKQ